MSNKPIICRIQKVIFLIDCKISNILNSVLHNNRFQKLEASWRGLYHLTHQMPDQDKKHIKIKVLNVTWGVLAKDLLRNLEFDQSQLFSKIYTCEFGQAGGEPFGLLVGDYIIAHTEKNLMNTIEMLRAISIVAASAFAPFVSAISPHFFGVNDFNQNRPIDLESIFKQHAYQVWQKMREDEDMRFLGLILPNVLLRLPYQNKKAIHHPFCFSEAIRYGDDYLWGNPAYFFAATVVRAFSKTGWFCEIRGLSNTACSSEIFNLPLAQFSIDHSFLGLKMPLNMYITPRQEKYFSDHGFIALSVNEKTKNVAFYDCCSIQIPKKYAKNNAHQNSKLSSMLHYVLCISRFAHYLKIIARQRIGTFATAKECEAYLQNWIQQYTAANTDLSETLRIRYPLREAKVHVEERLGAAGSYVCTLHISPHDQFDQVQTWLHLKTEI